MNVGVVGLGLMGASFAKTLHKKCGARVFGTDNDSQVMQKALLQGIADEQLTPRNAHLLDVLAVTVYPRDFYQATKMFASFLKAGTIVTDFCGNKRIVVQGMAKLQHSYPQLTYIGCHPMAGRELSGIDNSVDNLFDGASAILVPQSDNPAKLEFFKNFLLSLGFGTTVVCSAEDHDTIVAYTSQLCHIVSNAFIKSATASKHKGFSAGSYSDLTRVARLNSAMWAQLMTDNRDKLGAELDELIANLQKYRKALSDGDEKTLQVLLEEGNLRKIQIDSEKPQ